MSTPYDLAAYIWPAYHHEARMADVWPDGDGEWHNVRHATPRFDGHDMPRQPHFGYQDEADPAVMQQHVELAATYGINTFIMDWYWFDEAPCFERQLNDALIPALEQSDSKCYLMWANHDATSAWDRNRRDKELRWSGRVDFEAFKKMADRVLDRYLTKSWYYRIDGRPVWCIYHIMNFVLGMGSVETAREALEWMRQRAKDKGLPDIHIQAINMRTPPVEMDAIPDGAGLTVAQLIGELHCDSVTDYQFIHHSRPGRDYREWSEDATGHWEAAHQQFPAYYPHVSIGWDNTQRIPDAGREQIVHNATPDAFARVLGKAKAFVDEHGVNPKLITINSWNEWTEGSYLLPDKSNGFGYLEAVREVFALGVGG